MENTKQAAVSQMYIATEAEGLMRVGLNVSLTSELGAETIQLSILLKNPGQKMSEVQEQALNRAKLWIDSAINGGKKL